jgi:hypothetical protein
MTRSKHRDAASTGMEPTIAAARVPAATRHGNGVAHVEFHVARLDREYDAAAIRRGLSEVPGVAQLTVFPTAAKSSSAVITSAAKPWKSSCSSVMSASSC